jgi:DNA polymerase-1
MPKTLFLIDGHSQMFRAYHAMRPGSMTSPTGEPTWATQVFLSMLLKLLKEQKPDYLAMAIDGPRQELKRTEFYPDYKANRPPTPEDFRTQEQRILQIIEALGLPILRVQGYEADDILATAVETLASEEIRVVLVSRDKDLDQLVTSNAVLYDPMKDETLDAETIEAKKGYRPEQAVEVQALTGDTSDNIPGVPGVGPKTAVKLIAKYGSAEEVLAHADEQTPKLAENLKKHAEDLKLSRELVELDRHVPIEFDIDAMHIDRLRFGDIKPILEELGFNRLFDTIRDLADGVADDAPPAGSNALFDMADTSSETTAEDFDYRLIDTEDALHAVAEELAGTTQLAMDTETTSLGAMWCSLVGISLAWEPGKGVYIPVLGPLGAAVLDVELVREVLEPIFSDEKITKIGHNLKYDLIVLRQAGFEVSGPWFDTMVAAHVIDSSRMTYKLDAIAMELLRHRCIPIEDVIGRGRNQTTMNTIPTEAVAVYAAEDADITLRLAGILRPQLDRDALTDLFNELEMPLLPVLTAMERTGIIVDPQRLKTMEQELSTKADRLREAILEEAGRPFNPDSPKQLSEVLFEEMALPILKKTKTGASTDSEVLEQLAAEHACHLAELVLDYRKLTKLVSTYLLALAECIHPTTGRVHTSFHQAGTATGRLSSSDPNLQNIPIRTEEGRRIRSAFVATDGWMLLAADYSQVELRMLAHFCQDETMMRTFAEDQDIHRTVAAEVFDVAPEDVTPEMRARAKTVNFGIIYGQTAFGLARTLGIPRRDAQEFINAYRQRFPKIQDFLQECIAQAKKHGYVETILKRRRAIPEIDARNPQRRAMAERLAINSVVQGSAADLIKRAMVNLHRRIQAETRPARMLLQIHDELVFEIPADAVDAERAVIEEEMTGAIELDVPLKVDIGIGRNWMDAK